MRVKRFVARTMSEATARIKSEMGKDAVILHTRHFKEGGFLGFFGRYYVEVTAALDNSEEELQQKLALPGEKKFSPEGQAADVLNDLKEMKLILNGMAHMLGQTGEQASIGKFGRELLMCLKKQEVEEELARQIVNTTLEQAAYYPEISEEQVKRLFLSNLLKRLKKGEPINCATKRLNKPYIYALVGPTGVGKTTTIAKLAASYAIIERKKVAFVTVDTYRIAAVDQLKAIGDIMNVLVNVVYSPQELKECLTDLADYEMIFIDTAGRSHKNSLQIQELKSFLDVAAPDDTFLVISATCKYKDILDIIGAYEEVNISRLIFTKLDETSSYGPLYSVACMGKYPLSYITNGQNIPDDISVADPLQLIDLLMKE